MDGKIDIDAMRRNSMELKELRMMLRLRDVFAVSAEWTEEGKLEAIARYSGGKEKTAD